MKLGNGENVIGRPERFCRTVLAKKPDPRCLALYPVKVGHEGYVIPGDTLMLGKLQKFRTLALICGP